MNAPGTEQAKGAAEGPLGLYVHVPFCASTCDFCAFYQIPPTAAKVRSFLDGVEREAALVDWRPVRGYDYRFQRFWVKGILPRDGIPFPAGRIGLGL